MDSWVEITHPENPGIVSTVTSNAYEKVWRDKGWTLVGGEPEVEAEGEPSVEGDTGFSNDPDDLDAGLDGNGD